MYNPGGAISENVYKSIYKFCLCFCIYIISYCFEKCKCFLKKKSAKSRISYILFQICGILLVILTNGALRIRRNVGGEVESVENLGGEGKGY